MSNKISIISIFLIGGLIYLWASGPTKEELAARNKAATQEMEQMLKAEEARAEERAKERAKECEQDPVRCAVEDAYKRGYEEGYEAGLEAAYERDDYDLDDRDYDRF